MEEYNVLACYATQSGRKLDEPTASSLREEEEMLSSSAVMMETRGFSETSVIFYQSTVASHCRRQKCL
jgi:hypothetical protein